MADINCVTLTGRLTRDAELKYSQNGNAIVNFTLAVGSRKRNPDGTWGDEASFFDCVYFGKGAEATNSYLTKGRMIAISGELRQNKFVGNDGQTRSKVEIVVGALTLTSGQGRGSDTSVADSVMQNRGQNSYGGNSYAQPQAGNNNYNNNSYSNNADSGYSKPQAQPRPVLANGPEDFQDDDIPF